MTHKLRMTAVLGPQGRMVIPAKIRKSLHLEEGSKIELESDGSTIKMQDVRTQLAAIRQSFRKYRWKPDEPNASDQLVQERRAEAMREDW